METASFRSTWETLHGPWVFTGVLSRQHAVPCEQLLHFSLFPPFCVLDPAGTKGLPRPPDENTVVRMWLSNAVRGLQPEEHMSWLLHWLYQTLGFQLWGTPSLWEGFPQWLSGKASTCKAGDTGDESLIPELGRSPGEGNDYPLQ